MYEVIKKVIESKKYELSDILKKIDTLWLQGDISDSQKDSLITLARTNAEISNSVDVLVKLEEMNKRLTSVEAELKALKLDSSDTENEETIVAEYEAGKWYYAGDKVSFNGNTYTCTAPDGVVCVWSPADYPTYWEIEE